MKALLVGFRAYLHKFMTKLGSDWAEFEQLRAQDGHLLPNRITLVRIKFSPFPGLLLWLSICLASSLLQLVAAILFGAVALTDSLDGYLARKRKEITFLGKVMDPLADKINILFSVPAVAILYPYKWILLSIVIMLFSEVAVFCMSLGARHRGKEVNVTWLGKIKTTLSGIAIFVLYLPLGNSSFIQLTHNWAMGTATAFAVLSMAVYAWLFILDDAFKRLISKVTGRG